MKNILWLTALSIVAVFVMASVAQSQDNPPVTVTISRSDVVSGVVILTGTPATTASGKKSGFELQCNKGMSMCNPVKAGTYTMVRLPKNRGMYECNNTELYPSGADPETADKIGAYCLIEK
jgi:hypothetical protein